MARINAKKTKEAMSINYNKEKTNELIKEMKEKGVIVGIEDLPTFLRKKGVVCKVHIGGMGSEIKIPLELYGVDLGTKGDEVKTFIERHLRNARMCFIPIEDQNYLKNIIQSTRAELKNAAVGYDGTFIPIEAYREFRRYFRKKKAKYLLKVREICFKWDTLIEKFKRDLSKSMDELNSINKDAIYSQIVACLPNKYAYKNSFYMLLETKAFPVPENLNMFDDDIKHQIEDGLNEDTINMLYDVIAESLNDAFQSINNALFSIQKSKSRGGDGSADKRTIASIRTSIDRMGQKNIFHNEKIEEIRQDMENVIKKENEKMYEAGEILLSKIYVYSKELRIDSKINLTESVLTREDMNYIFKITQEQKTETIQLQNEKTTVFDQEINKKIS